MSALLATREAAAEKPRDALAGVRIIPLYNTRGLATGERPRKGAWKGERHLHLLALVDLGALECALASGPWPMDWGRLAV
jgi:hypothetical protein